MNSAELRATLALSLLFALRMVGLFMVLPVLTLHQSELRDATPLLMGLALGAHGLTQALLQIPFGLLSDRIGRRPVISLGLLLFIAGSVVAALSSSVYGIIAGRLLQGSGAIASPLMALLADLTRDQVRTQSMAIMGVSIGLSFSAALILGPMVTHVSGLSGIFWISALLAIAGELILLLLVPKARQQIIHRNVEAVPGQLGQVLADRELLRLNFGVFALHFMMMASFVVLPMILTQQLSIPVGQHWHYYLPIIGVSFFAMLPFLIIAETRQQMKPVFLGALALVIISQLLLSFDQSDLWSVVAALFVFFMGFNLLESTLPSLVSKMAPAGSKGTAMGMSSSSQFLGAFFGAASGGALMHWCSASRGYQPLFLALAGIGLLWFLLACGMKRPRTLLDLRLDEPAPEDPYQAELLLHELRALAGVAEVALFPDSGEIYLKLDRQRLDDHARHRLSLLDA
ncbi:MAG TPA: MFS transporter [Pseudomonadales bacterium]|jgi:MFS family permease|nr:MFS transporter [Pseudomonadales bacterium]HMW14968.1 MFS transporter [Pseudomonadales bacterium]HMW82999.1 MFS transporter [Pseudomonadales bacterium]HMY96732.1 MFS transporter [Pseudomonadales bacterium]HMZ70443.1 MFS transporter [Pseudomonadales bacterium]